jgi:hypothetical protein
MHERRKPRDGYPAEYSRDNQVSRLFLQPFVPMAMIFLPGESRAGQFLSVPAFGSFQFARA